MQHGRGNIMHVTLLRQKVLPDGAQYNGKRWLFMDVRVDVAAC